MRADIAQPRRSEQCIAQGMGQDVAIRMARRTLVEWQLNTAYDQFSTCLEAMQVVANACPRGSRVATVPPGTFFLHLSHEQKAKSDKKNQRSGIDEDWNPIAGLLRTAVRRLKFP